MKSTKLIATVFLILFALPLIAATGEKDTWMEDGKPDNHRADWDVKHQSYANADAKSCKQCHKSLFCVQCHQRRTSIKETVHRRNFINYHSVTARANPRKCDNCHRVSWCVDCHKRP